MTGPESNRLAILIAVGFGFLALLWGVMIPVGESPDEQAHIAYAEFLSSNLSLPTAVDTMQSVQGEAVQPPLYYAFLALLVRAVDYRGSRICWVPNSDFDRTTVIGRANAYLNRETRNRSGLWPILLYHLLRIPTAVFGAFVIWWTWLGLRELKQANPIALVLLAIWATSPQMPFMSGIVGNDIPAAAMAALFFWLFARWMRQGDQKSLIYAGFALTAALLTKNTIVPLWLGTVIVCAFNIRRPQFRLGLMVLLFIPLLLAGWSIVRGQMLLDPVMADKIEADRIVGINDGIVAYSVSWLISAAKHIYHFNLGGIGVLGLNSILMPGFIYGWYVGIGMAILGVIWKARPMRWANWLNESFSSSIIGVFILSAAGIYLFREAGDAVPGRHGLAYFPGLLALTMVSLDRHRNLSEAVNNKYSRSSFWIVVTGGGFVLSLISLISFTMWAPLVATVVKGAGFGMPVEHYFFLANTFIAMAVVMFAILCIWQWKAESLLMRWNPSAGQIALIAGILYGSNVIWLFFYVLNFYS